MRRWLSLLSLALATTLSFALISEALAEAEAPPLAPSSDPEPSWQADDGPTADELALFDRVNAERLYHGLAALSWDAELLPIARARAEEQARHEQLTHLNALGRLAFVDLLSMAGHDFRVAGENLARLPAVSPDVAAQAHLLLMSSEVHRAAILQPAYERLAIGGAVDPAGRVVFAELFLAS